MKAFLFDLDMTLVDSSELEGARNTKKWEYVRENLGKVKPYTIGSISAHDLPKQLKASGSRVGIVTSSPKWYAESIIKRFNISCDALVAFGDTKQHKPDPEPIIKTLECLGVTPGDACYIGDNDDDMQAGYRAGVTSIGAVWQPAYLNELAAPFAHVAPDVLVYTPDTLLDKEKLSGMGYFAEVVVKAEKPHSHHGSVLRCVCEIGNNARIPTYALGRYYSPWDPRHSKSVLSRILLEFKTKDSQTELLAASIAHFIKWLDWTPDFIVPVPPKPTNPYQRFKTLLENKLCCIPSASKVRLDGLRCIKEVPDYKKMCRRDRDESIRGTIVSEHLWKNARVLLIDDILTSGTTSAECARVLRAAGAIEVRSLVLGKAQDHLEVKLCPKCKRPMRLCSTKNYNKDGSEHRFWGCSGYPDACRYIENISDAPHP